MAQGALRQRFGGDAAVFAENVLFQRAAVDAYPDGDAVLPAAVGYGPDAVRRADVAGVDTYLVHAAVDAQQRQLVVKVDVRHQGYMDAGLDGGDGHSGLTGGNGHTDDVAARLLQTQNLGHSGVHVLRGRIAHGLDGDRRAAAYGHRANVYLPCHERPSPSI